jgi:hypothetical protein
MDNEYVKVGGLVVIAGMILGIVSATTEAALHALFGLGCG